MAARWLRGGCGVAARWLRGGCGVAARWLRGGCGVVVSWLRGDASWVRERTASLGLVLDGRVKVAPPPWG